MLVGRRKASLLTSLVMLNHVTTSERKRVPCFTTLKGFSAILNKLMLSQPLKQSCAFYGTKMVIFFQSRGVRKLEKRDY
jgi:hypothetical protein